jgi:glycosyltransferase 2 family protein
LKNNQWIVYMAGILLLLGLALWVPGHVHFQWSVFREQLQHVVWWRIAAAIALIFAGYGLRAVRWAMLIKPQMKASWTSLLGSQIIGFTAVAIFGRLADLVRPYLVSRRTQLSLSSQIAVYTVERIMDAGAMAVIFSLILLFTPDRASLPHHEAVRKLVLTGLATLVLGVIVIRVKAFGEAAARLAEKGFGTFSSKVGAAIGNKIRTFRESLNVIRNFGDFVMIGASSLLMWAMITWAYLETVHAFVLSPQLASMTLGRCLVLMAASMAGSIVQLPVIGWFTQIAATAGAMEKLLGVAFEPALGCGAMLLIVSFMCVIPLGLVWARVEHVSLKKVSEESELLVAEEAGESVAPTAG